MTDDGIPRPSIRFSDEIDYYDSTDFAMVTGTVENDSWIGTGDAMATFALLGPNGTARQVHLPVHVDNGPVTRGAVVFCSIDAATGQEHGETQISLTEVSGADSSGADTWTVYYGPIRSPFD